MRVHVPVQTRSEKTTFSLKSLKRYVFLSVAARGKKTFVQISRKS